MRLIDGDKLKVHHGVNVGADYGGLRAVVFKKDIDKAPTIEPPTTEWLGNHTPFRCKKCGHYSDTRTPYCAYCGRRAINT